MYIVLFLKAKLKALMLPPDLENKINLSTPDIEDFDDMSEFIAAMDASSPASPLEIKIIDEIAGIKTIEEAKNYWESNRARFLTEQSLSVDEYIKNLERDYLKNRKSMTKLHKDYSEEPGSIN